MELVLNSSPPHSRDFSRELGGVFSCNLPRQIQYHVVWCVKYRRKVLIDDVEQSLKKELLATAQSLGVRISAMECMSDHIHLLLDCSPQHYIPTVVKILKGNSARHLFMLHPSVKEKLWDGHLWNPSYFVATVSEQTSRQIEEYISRQKSR